MNTEWREWTELDLTHGARLRQVYLYSTFYTQRQFKVVDMMKLKKTQVRGIKALYSTTQICLVTLWRGLTPRLGTTVLNYLTVSEVAPPRPATTATCCLHISINNLIMSYVIIQSRAIFLQNQNFWNFNNILLVIYVPVMGYFYIVVSVLILQLRIWMLPLMMHIVQ